MQIRTQLMLFILASIQIFAFRKGIGASWRSGLPVVVLCCCNFVDSSSHHEDNAAITTKTLAKEPSILMLDGDEVEVALVKIGGSSITNKAQRESINDQALQWFSQTIKNTIHAGFTSPTPNKAENICRERDNATGPSKGRRRAFVIVHGAGSFGHHTAKEYALKGQFSPPPTKDSNSLSEATQQRRRWTMEGLARTRVSVQTLNQMLVSSLVAHGVNAVAISPCFAIPNMQAHGGDKDTTTGLGSVIRDTIQAGLVPVLHGDACLYGTQNAGILSGDVLMEKIGQQLWVSQAIFPTDVDGVFSSDPRVDPKAKLLMEIEVDIKSLDIISPVLNVTGSSHEHDVTGGLKTKLASAAIVAASGKNVTIVKCGTQGAERVLRGEADIEKATTVYASHGA